MDTVDSASITSCTQAAWISPTAYRFRRNVCFTQQVSVKFKCVELSVKIVNRKRTVVRRVRLGPVAQGIFH